MFWEAQHGYAALGVKEGDQPEDPTLPFRLELLCEMIKVTDEQPDGVETVKERPQK